MTRGFAESLARVRDSAVPNARDIAFLLDSEDPEDRSLLFAQSARVRDEVCGRRVAVRGLVEFSSFCRNACRYCGLNRANDRAERYRLSFEEILESARLIFDSGIRTIVLQSGEDGGDAGFLSEVVRAVKGTYDMAVTLSVGERERADYELWRESGADRYLLRVESSVPGLYASWHEKRSLASRMRCLKDLRELGYQVGSGVMVGPPGQTTAHLAEDIAFFGRFGFDMIGIGPFIPHPDTPFRGAARGDVGLTLRVIAVTRLVARSAWMPATTALGSLERDFRVDALRAGANVLMPSFSPKPASRRYAIYPGKDRSRDRDGEGVAALERMAREAGLGLDYARADSLRMGDPPPQI